MAAAHVESRAGAEPDFIAHASAVLDAPCTVGAGTRIWHFCHVMAGARIGRDCVLGQNVMVGAGVVIGDHVRIQNNVSVFQGVELDDFVFCGPSVVFTNVLNPRSEISKKDEFRPTRVGRGASLGANATIVCGVTIGRYALVGAGAVVTRDVPDYGLVLGTPARRVGWACRCGETLPGRAGGAGAAATERHCPVCGNRYRERPGALDVIEEGGGRA